MKLILLAAALLTMAIPALAANWLPDREGEAHWGFVDGIQVALYPVALGTAGDGGPRGLLRIGYPILPGGGVHLVNFIAVEPTVAGQKGYSELEPGADGHPGKSFTVRRVQRSSTEGRERLEVEIDVEKFRNGAHVGLKLVIRSDHADEVILSADSFPDSAPIQECVLTATMGNYERLRQVWFNAGKAAESGRLYADYNGDGFARDAFFPLAKLHHQPDGSVLVPATTDEVDPRAASSSLPPGIFWRYPGRKVTQYWKAPAGTFSPHLVARVNARRVYWMSQLPLPGGIAFENFEMRDHFRSGQPFVFGVTSLSPAELMRE